MTHYLEITGLSRAFGKKQVLQNLDLHVRQGECLAVFGGSGAGKTTLLRHIAGMLEMDAGRIRIGGRDAAGLNAQERGVGMAFQNFALYPHLRARENIASPLRARRMPPAAIAARVQQVAALLRIDHVLDHLPRQLSNGQKQRTALARALVHQPPLLLLDDPLRNVDAKIRFEMRQEFPRLFQEFGTTVLYVTQDWREALALGERVGVLAGGKFAQIDTPQGIYRQPQSRAIARLFGDPPINLFEVTPRAAAGAGNSMEVEIGGARLRLPEMRADLIGRACVLGVRAEDVIFTPAAADTAPPDGGLPVQLQALMPLNVRTVALLRCGDVEIFSSRAEAAGPPQESAPRAAQNGTITVAAGACLFFDGTGGARL